jgi:hypothetical protein
MLKDPNLKGQMLINPVAVTPADMAAEIDRISGIVFQMLSFFALVDGLSNNYKHNTPNIQSYEYMEVVFDSPLRSFGEFLKLCSINLSTFGPPGSTVRANMAYIVEQLQPALAQCSDTPRAIGEVRFRAGIRYQKKKEVRQNGPANAESRPPSDNPIVLSADDSSPIATPPNRRGGTVKRRVRAQKRQKQTMRRPCNIRRRQRRSHSVCRRYRNKNKTH